MCLEDFAAVHGGGVRGEVAQVFAVLEVDVAGLAPRHALRVSKP